MDLATDELGLDVQRAEELNGFACYFGGSAGAFSVDGQGRYVDVLQMRTKPAGDGGIQGLGLEALQKTADSGFAGGEIFSGSMAAESAQVPQMILTEGGAEIADGQKRIVAGDHRDGDKGKNGSDLTVPPTSAPPRIGQFSKGLNEGFGLFKGQRILMGSSFTLHRSQIRGQYGSGQQKVPIRVNGIDKYRFGFGVELIKIQMRTTKAFGQADLRPIRRAVTSAFELFGVNEGFGQKDGMAIKEGPVLTEALEV